MSDVTLLLLLSRSLHSRNRDKTDTELLYKDCSKFLGVYLENPENESEKLTRLIRINETVQKMAN